MKKVGTLGCRVIVQYKSSEVYIVNIMGTVWKTKPNKVCIRFDFCK